MQSKSWKIKIQSIWLPIRVLLCRVVTNWYLSGLFCQNLHFHSQKKKMVLLIKLKMLYTCTYSLPWLEMHWIEHEDRNHVHNCRLVIPMEALLGHQLTSGQVTPTDQWASGTYSELDGLYHSIPKYQINEHNIYFFNIL